MSDTTQALELTHDHIHTLLGIGNPTEEESRLLRLGWIAGIEAVQAAAKCLHQIAEPAAWMDPVTMDVINDARKQAWTRDYGAGGAAKAAAYTVGLGPLAPAADAREVPAATEWRELCRRLYVELFSCDQQMMEATDEEGEPMWQQGSTVRDVLRDAKAMLAAAPAPAQEAAPALEAPAAFVRKPLAPEEIQAGHKAAGLEKMLDTFTMGVEFAEREHGVSAAAPQAPAAPAFPWRDCAVCNPPWTDDDSVRVIAITANDDFAGEQFHDVRASDFYGDGTEVTNVCTHWAYRDEIWPRASQAAPVAPAVDAREDVELLELVQAIVKFNKEHGSVLAVHIDNLADLLDERAAIAAQAKGGA